MTDNTCKYVNIVNEIRSHIRNGNLKPGARLLPSGKLAELMGCHHHTVLKAIKILERDGHLNSRSGSGTYVAGCADKKRIEQAPPELLSN